MFCDDTSAVSLIKNPIQHSRDKHIGIRIHFSQTWYLDFVSTMDQLDDIFTK